MEEADVFLASDISRREMATSMAASLNGRLEFSDGPSFLEFGYSFLSSLDLKNGSLTLNDGQKRELDLNPYDIVICERSSISLIFRNNRPRIALRIPKFGEATVCEVSDELVKKAELKIKRD